MLCLACRAPQALLHACWIFAVCFYDVVKPCRFGGTLLELWGAICTCTTLPLMLSLSLKMHEKSLQCLSCTTMVRVMSGLGTRGAWCGCGVKAASRRSRCPSNASMPTSGAYLAVLKASLLLPRHSIFTCIAKLETGGFAFYCCITVCSCTCQALMANSEM